MLILHSILDPEQQEPCYGLEITTRKISFLNLADESHRGKRKIFNENFFSSHEVFRLAHLNNNLFNINDVIFMGIVFFKARVTTEGIFRGRVKRSITIFLSFECINYISKQNMIWQKKGRVKRFFAIRINQHNFFSLFFVAFLEKVSENSI